MKSLFLILFLFVTFSNVNADGDKSAFTKKKIKLGGKTLTVEIADTNDKRSQGLMYRRSLGHDQGMLFIFSDEQSLSFWMKNTLIPLSIGYFARDQTLLETVEMVPAVASELSPPSYPSAHPAMFALEMPKGWYTKNKIRTGAKFMFVEKKDRSQKARQ